MRIASATLPPTCVVQGHWLHCWWQNLLGYGVHLFFGLVYHCCDEAQAQPVNVLLHFSDAVCISWCTHAPATKAKRAAASALSDR
jgi:hypothetical protein